MKHSKFKAYSHMGGVLRSLVLTLIIVVTMTASSFADVTISKEWDDGLTGTSANNRVLPTVSLSGETSYEKLLNLFYPVGCYFISENSSFDPNSEWGGTWVKVDAGKTLWTTTTADEVGTSVAAGLPNITGGFAPWTEGKGADITQEQGAFYSVASGQYGWGTSTGRDADNEYMYFDASRSNSIYGKSSTVQPPAVKVFIWKRTS